LIKIGTYACLNYTRRKDGGAAKRW